MIKKLAAFLEYDSPRFRFFNNPENNFRRIATGHAFAALLIAPLYGYIMYRSGAPDIYIYNAVCYAISFPILSTIFYLIKAWRSWLVYAFILELFVLTFLSYADLRASGFAQNELAFYFLFYAISSITIQRLYPAILYQLAVILALLADNQLIEKSENQPFFVVGVFLIVGITICTVVYLRRKLIFSIKDYVSYLKRIVNNPGMGYILLKQSNLSIVDTNDEVFRVFNIEENELSDVFSSFFNEEERNTITDLKLGHKFKKQISLSRHNTLKLCRNTYNNGIDKKRSIFSSINNKYH